LDAQKIAKTAVLTSDLSECEKSIEKKRKNIEQEPASYKKHEKKMKKLKNQIVVPQYHSQSSSSSSEFGVYNSLL